MQKMSSAVNYACLAIFGLLASMMPTPAHAYTAPSSGDVGYETYEFVTDVVFSGAIGWVIILGIIGYAVYWILRSNVFGAVSCFVAAAIFYSAEDIAAAMGLMF